MDGDGGVRVVGMVLLAALVMLVLMCVVVTVAVLG